MESKKMDKTYKILFWVFGSFTILAILLTGIYALGSLGHEFNPWGYRASLDPTDVAIEPPLDCLEIYSGRAFGIYNAINFAGCRDEIIVNGKPLESRYNLDFGNKTVSVDLNGLMLQADKKNILNFDAEYRGDTQTIRIPIKIENGTVENLKGLLIIFSPTIALILLTIIYFLKKKLKVDLAFVRKLKKISLYSLLGAIISIGLAIVTTIGGYNNFVTALLFPLSLILILVLLPLGLLLLIITQLILWIWSDNHKGK